jgi:hypothetical protein
MKKFLAILAILAVLCPLALAVEIPLPDGMTEEQLKKGVAYLQEQTVNRAVNKNPIVVAEREKAKLGIDAYRKSIGLAAKYEAVTPVEKPTE